VIYNGFDHGDHDTDDTLDPRGGEPVLAQGQVVGHLFFRSMVSRVYNPREEQFLASLTASLAATLAVQWVIAGLLGGFLASRFVRPITRLETAVKRITEGTFQDHVAIEGRNEIAHLSHHFNRMVDQLRAQETARQNLLADLAHELRTPVSILQANLEMMIDGVYTADRARLASLYEETQLLAKLIGDLRTLSDLELGASSAQPERVALTRLVADVCERHRPRFDDAQTPLAFEGGPDVEAWADPQGLVQVVGNLLENALKYAPGTPVTVSVQRAPGRARLVVTDGGPGVAPDELEKIFQRFYRADASRNRETGGRGLGLALCRQLVSAWGATIRAERPDEGGLRVVVEWS